ncbi:MAG: DUF4189 domain-containing protein [Lysobacter sp.]|nr:DUF4189 domain-containing protein [Lysobacter sp.]
MKSIGGFLVLVSMLAFARPAAAEDGCPAGFIPNATGTPNVQCIPAGGSGYSAPFETWERRWGAFTSDAVTGKIGLATAMSSKRKAVKEAMRDCQARGGAQCKLLLTFTNQCAAIASGKEAGSTYRISAGSGVNATVAKQVALQECGRYAESCEIFLTECSYAEQVQ